MEKTLKNIAVICAAVLLVSISALLFTSCSKVPDPEKTVHDAVAAVKAYNTEAMEAYWGKNLAGIDGRNSIAKKICGGIGYEIISSHVDGDRASVTVEISNTDMAALTEDLRYEQKNSDTALAMLLCRPGNSRCVSTVEIHLELIDGRWEICENKSSGAVFAMLGGMCSLDAICPGISLAPVGVGLAN